MIGRGLYCTHFIRQYTTPTLLIQETEPVDAKKLVALELHILRKGLRLFGEEIFWNTLAGCSDKAKSATSVHDVACRLFFAFSCVLGPRRNDGAQLPTNSLALRKDIIHGTVSAKYFHAIIEHARADASWRTALLLPLLTKFLFEAVNGIKRP